MSSHRIFAFFAALTVLTGSIGSGQMNAAAEELAENPRLTVDINRNDGRVASYARWAENWIIDSETSASAEIGGLTFTVRTETEGGVLYAANNKKLQKYSGIYPNLTMDGVTVTEAENGVLRLEISGLSAGRHSLKTWHSCAMNAAVSTMRISIGGKVMAEGVACPVNVTDEDDAGISYSVFEVAEGETVTVLIEPEGEGSAWLNAFELDGSDPFEGISRIMPEHMDFHYDVAEGLSWTAGTDAVSHDVYLGTDETAVYGADSASPEFMGNQTGTTYALDENLSAVPTYYWRVDTIDREGNVHKGSVNSFRLKRLAFPTAEGYGRYAAGGRGGEVIHVTSLNDDVNQEGTLRWALENEIWQTDDWRGVPRIVVFDVGGIIELKDDLTIPQNGGSVYVAGQTAPGDGITLTKNCFGAMGASDVIIRDVRVRVGNYDWYSCGMSLSCCDNSIIDHCSMSWATDEGFSSRHSKNVTFQWNIISESVDEYSRGCYPSSNVLPEPHSFAASIGDYYGSYHHNLLTNCTGRNWSMAGGLEYDYLAYEGRADICNNVVYNWYDRTTDGGLSQVNFVNNYYKAGPASKTDLHIISTDGNELLIDDMQRMYVSGNMMVDTDGTVLLDPAENAWDAGKAVSGDKGGATAADIRSDEPFFPSYVNTETAEEAYESVLAHAGAGGMSERDYIDSRYIEEVTNGTVTYTGSKSGLSGMPNSVADVGGYPTAETFAHSTDGATNAENDTDRDGMPNVWEEAHGLNPADPADGSVVSLSAEDYTNVEMYLNELMGDTVSYAEPVKGDVNADGTCSLVDRIMLQKWLLGAARRVDGDAADMNGDGRINIFDLCLLKDALYREKE